MWKKRKKKIHFFVCLSKGEGGTNLVFLFCSPLRRTTNDFDDDFDATTLLRRLLDEEETSLKPHLFPSSPGWRRTTRRRVSERGERHRL